MTRTVSAICIAAALSVGITLGAQSPQEVKVTGCLGKDAAGKEVILTSAVVEPGGGAAGSLPDSIRTATTFRVQGSDLDRHVSEKVEILGSATPPPTPPAPSPAAAPGAAAPTAAPARPAAGASATANAPRLEVKTLKMIHRYPCF